MNANAEIKIAENLTEIYTPTAEHLNIRTYEEVHRGAIPFIDEMIKDIEETRYLLNCHYKSYKDLEVSRKCKNISEFLSKHRDDLLKIRLEEGERNFIENEKYYKRYSLDDFKKMYGSKKYEKELSQLKNLSYIAVKKYKYEKELTNEKVIDQQIFKLIVDVLYCDIIDEGRYKLVAKFQYLHKRQFKFDYLYLDRNHNKQKLFFINRIFKWIKRCIKGKKADAEYKKIFECVSEYIPSSINTEIEKNFDCIICDTNVKFTEVEKNCVCNENICSNCFLSLSRPKKCPTCRKEPFKHSIYNTAHIPPMRNINYRYNNKLYHSSFKCSKYDDESILYFDTEKEEIGNFTFNFKTEYEMISDFIECNLEDRISQFDIGLLYDYFNPTLPRQLFNVMMENVRYENYGSELLDYFNLTTDGDDEHTRGFIEYCVNIDGLFQTLLIDEDDYEGEIEIKTYSGTETVYVLINKDVNILFVLNKYFNKY
jgi:hypothetical protein